MRAVTKAHDMAPVALEAIVASALEKRWLASGHVKLWTEKGYTYDV